MNQFIVLLNKEAKEIIRSKKLLVMAILFLFTAIASPIIAKILPQIMQNVSVPGMIINLPESTWRDAIDQLIKNISQIVGIVLVFLFAGAIAEEKNKKTLEIVLTKPISRANLILAKIISSVGLLGISLLVMAIIFYFYTYSLLGSFSVINFSWLILVLFIYLSLIATITIFMSTIAGNQITAVGMAFALEIILLTLLDYIKAIKHYLPGYAFGHYKEIMADGKIVDFLPSILISLALIVLFTMFSVTIFKNQEIER